MDDEEEDFFGAAGAAEGVGGLADVAAGHVGGAIGREGDAVC